MIGSAGRAREIALQVLYQLDIGQGPQMRWRFISRISGLPKRPGNSAGG
jgi:hypothetical protein